MVALLVKLEIVPVGLHFVFLLHYLIEYAKIPLDINAAFEENKAALSNCYQEFQFDT